MLTTKDADDGKIATIFTKIHDEPIKSMKEVKQFKHIQQFDNSKICNFPLNHTIIVYIEVKHIFDKGNEKNDLLYASHFQKKHSSRRLLPVHPQKFRKRYDRHNLGSIKKIYTWKIFAKLTSAQNWGKLLVIQSSLTPSGTCRTKII